MRKFLSSLYWGETKPTQRVEVFDALWNDLVQTSERLDPEDETSVPKLLNRLIQLLLEDERDIDNGTGECIEKFLKGRVMETLCKLAETNKPHGMYRWIVHAISRIFQHMKSPLLAHMSIHKPVVHLLKDGAALRLGPEERMECLHLIDSIILKLKEDPVFVRLFFEDFFPDGSPATILYTATGSPTKRPAPLDDSDDVKEERRRFVLFSTLQTMYQQGGDHRLVDQIRRSILSCLAVDDNHDNIMDVFYSNQSSFLNFVVDSLLEAYWRAFTATPKHSGARHIGESYQNQQIQSYLKTVQFCNSLTKLPHRNFFTEKLMELLKRKFVSVVISGLLSEDVEVANLHTIYVRETLLQIDSKPFHALLVKAIVEEAPQSHLEHALTAETDPNSAAIIVAATRQVQDVLIDRLEYFRGRRHSVQAGAGAEHAAPIRHKSLLVSVAENALLAATTVTAAPIDAVPVPVPAHSTASASDPDHQSDESKVNLERLNREQIAVNTLRLFSTLLSFHPGDKYVVENLVLKMNDGSNTGVAKSIAENSVLIKEFLSRVDNLHLRLAETLASVPETSDLTAQEVMTTVYNSHVQKKLAKNRHYFSQWFAKTGDSSAGAEVALDQFSERPFMRALFSLLGHFLKNTLDLNLAITDVISKLSHQPSKVLHSYLLTPHNAAGRHSLVTTLEELSVATSALITERPDLAIGAERLLRTWTQTQHIECVWEYQDETTRAIQAIVLLEEFCKELHAVMSNVDSIITTPH